MATKKTPKIKVYDVDVDIRHTDTIRVRATSMSEAKKKAIKVFGSKAGNFKADAEVVTDHRYPLRRIYK